jgi:hypothetical protein
VEADEHLRPDTPAERFREAARAADGDPQAAYALLAVGEEMLKVQPYRVAYDVVGAVSALRDRGLPEAFSQMLLQERGLSACYNPGWFDPGALKTGRWARFLAKSGLKFT